MKTRLQLVIINCVLYLPVQFLMFASSVNPLIQEHTSALTLDEPMLRTHCCSQTLSTEQFLLGSTANMRNCTGKYKTQLMITSCKRVFILYLQMLHECSSSNTNPCTQNCTNTIGSICVSPIVPVVIDSLQYN